MEREKIIERIPWHWIIPLTVLYVVLVNCGTAFLTAAIGGIYNFQENLYVMEFRSAPLVGIIILYILVRIRPSLRKWLSETNLAYLYAVLLVANIFAGPFWPWRVMGSWFRARLVTDRTAFLPLFWTPSESVFSPIIMGGAATPWGEWAIPLLFWTVFYVTLFLYFISWSSIFRRQWIDVEGVPFPYATLTYTPISLMSAGAERRDVRQKFLVYGLIIGILVYLPPVINLAFPWIPDIYGWRTSPLFDASTQGAFHAAQVFPGLGGSVVGFFAIQTNPGATAIAYLAPMHTLISVTFFSILFVYIIPQIAYSMGYYSGIFTARTTGDRVYRIYVEPPFKYEALNFGVYAGILVFWLILNWRYIANTLKSARAAKAGEKLETGEPQTYLEAYITLVLSSIIMVVLLIVSGLDMVTAPVFLVTAFLIGMGGTRIQGLGGAVPGGWTFAHTLYRAVWPPGSLTAPNQNFALSFTLTQKNMVEAYGFAPLAQTPLNTYRMAALTHANCRNLLKVMLVTTILGVPIGLATMLWLGYTFGFNKLPMAITYTYGTFMETSVDYFNRIPGPDPIWPNIGAGFALTGILSFLHFRFLWWPLEPIGLVLALNRPFQKAAFWMSFAEALILKYLTLKIGGTKAYEEYGVPLVAGFIGGFTIMVILGMTTGIFRFFYPA